MYKKERITCTKEELEEEEKIILKEITETKKNIDNLYELLRLQRDCLCELRDE
jgi:predicted Zn-dependent peptidase